VLLFLYAPLAVVVAYAFNANPRNVTQWTGFTAGWFGTVLGDEEVLDAVWTSLVIAVPNAVLAALLGTAAALGLRRAPARLRALYDALAYLTLVTPVVVLGIAALVFFIAAGVPRSELTVLLTHVVFNSSIVMLVVRARAVSLGTEEEQAAYDLGATRWGVLRQVTLPRLAPAILAGALLAFTFSWDDYVIASFVAGPESVTLPIRIFSSLRFGLTPEINALATLLLLVNVVIVGLVALLLRRGSRRATLRALPRG